MKAETMSGMLVLMAGIFLVSSKPTTVGDTDVVSEILQAIEGRREMTRVVDYLKASRDDLLKEFPLFNPDGAQQSYTFFAPTSFAFALQTPQDTVDPLFVDADLRLKVLIRHFARQSISPDGLAKLDSLVMADSKEAVLTFQNQNEVCNLPPTSPDDVCEAYQPMWTFNSAAGKCENYVYGGCFRTENLFKTEVDCLSVCGPTTNTRTQLINEAEIEPEAVNLPNDIVAVYIVGRAFLSGDEVNEAISSHFQRNPNTALCLGLPCSSAESRAVTDDEATALDIHHTPLAPPPEIPAPPGSYTVLSLDAADVLEIAEFATKALSESANRASPLMLVDVVKAERQLVAGFNYRLQLQLKENTDANVFVCDVVVFDQSWSSTREIASSFCDSGPAIAPYVDLEPTPLS